MAWHLRKAQRARCAPIFFFVFVLLPFRGGPTHFREGPCLPDGYLNTNYNKQRAIRLLQPLQPTLGQIAAIPPPRPSSKFAESRDISIDGVE